MTTFHEYQKNAKKTAIYPIEVQVLYPVLGLAGEVGEMANKFKKWLMRDVPPELKNESNTNKLTDEQKWMLEGELGDILWYLAAICTDLGISLETVADKNIEKLLDRMNRGVIGGSGDNR